MEKVKTNITINASVNASVENVWKFYTQPNHVIKWNAASEDWHTTKSENNLKVGGKFLSRMEAKDGSFGFDFEGTYNEVKTNKLIAYTMSEGRNVKITFSKANNVTIIVLLFEAEFQNSIEMQQSGWQAILNSFKKYVEAN